jgi:hypothetical protein
MFEGSSKKTSIAITTEQNKNIHSGQINSIALVANYLVTADMTGFIKYWQCP